MLDFSLEPYLSCQDVSSLEIVIESNATAIDKWCNSGYANIKPLIRYIRQFVSEKGTMLAELDFKKPSNRVFIIQLYDICCALLLPSPAAILYHIINENELLLGHRLEAAMMVLHSYGSNDEYIDAFLPICKKLDLAIKEEDDDEWPCISVFIRYYAKIVRDLSPYIANICSLINQNKNQFAFLQSDLIKQALEINTADTENAYTQILSILSSTSIPSNELGTIQSTPLTKEKALQSKSEYETNLALCDRNFWAIRSLSYTMEKKFIEDSDAIFRSLGRGIRVLTAEEQLFVYMRAYGPMHEAKLKSAFEKFPFDEVGEEIAIVDWGCGQAIATIVFLEYLQSHFPSTHINNVLLIEPSSIAIERAKIHVLHYDKTIKIETINKGFDAIMPSEVSMSCSFPVLHLFSNILDYEGYELTHLEKIVENCSKGKNYFICASPHINEIKTARLASFERYFSNKVGYKHIYDIENTAGTWENNWTRVLRIFRYAK